MEKKSSFILTLFLLSPSFLFCQKKPIEIENVLRSQPYDRNFIRQIQVDVGVFAADGFNIFTAPSHFSGKEWLLASSVFAGTALAYFADRSVQNESRDIQSQTMLKITNVGEKYGRTLYATAFGGAVYATGYLFDNESISEAGRDIVTSVFFTGLITSLIKYSVSRARPYEQEGPADFFDYTFTESNVSFPSGHTATAFALSTVLANKIDNTYASIALYGLAGLTAFQRVYGDKHWFSDVFFGAALGTFIGNVVTNDGTPDPEDEDIFDNIEFAPTVNQYGAGLNLHLQF